MVCGFHRLSIFLLALTGGVLSDGSHYPDGKYNRKPCLRRNNTIQYENPICQKRPGGGGFTDYSRKNCEEHFRTSECPEFNKGKCELCNIDKPLYNGSSETKDIGCCKLYYNAGKKTWAEVYYANQYGPSYSDPPSWVIVEIKRMIRKPESLKNRNQKDWPNNVLDFEGEQGLKWIQMNTSLFNKTLANEVICRGGPNTFDTGCTMFLKYIQETWFASGFSTTLDIKPSQFELHNNAFITYELEGHCKNILVQKEKNIACQVLYTRRARFYYSTSESASYTPVTRQHDSSFVYLTVQLYQLFNDRNVLTLHGRYAYLSQEPAEERDEIFSNGA